MNQIIRELKRQFAGEKLEPEQLKGLIRAGYVYRNGDAHLLTEKGRDALVHIGVHPGVANDQNDMASKSSIDLADETYLVESFLDECRADPWFRDRPELLDRIEEVLTKFYRASDQNPEWQAIWDRICEILEQKNEWSAVRRWFRCSSKSRGRGWLSESNLGHRGSAWPKGRFV
jgi:hypothetical protein